MHKGQVTTKETRDRMRLSQLGHTVSDATRAKISATKKSRCHALSPEHRLKLSNALKGLVRTAENRANISKGGMGHAVSAETLRKLSLSHMGHRASDETKQKMGAKSKQRWSNTEYKARVVKSMRQVWNNPDFKAEQLFIMRAGCYIHPNKAEASLLELLNEVYPSEWEFVGDGSLIIGGKMPDYVNVNGRKQIIELFGNYWHRGQNPQDRIDLFKKYGFDTLVIWENELKDKDKVTSRISSFVQSIHTED